LAPGRWASAWPGASGRSTWITTAVKHDPPTFLKGGTAITWHASFLPKIPGTGPLLARGLRRFLDQCAHGLADHAAASQPTQDATRPT
jgi:hypothetical protein